MWDLVLSRVLKMPVISFGEGDVKGAAPPAMLTVKDGLDGRVSLAMRKRM